MLLFHITNISVDLAHNEIFHGQFDKGDKTLFVSLANYSRHVGPYRRRRRYLRCRRRRPRCHTFGFPINNF